MIGSGPALAVVVLDARDAVKRARHADALGVRIVAIVGDMERDRLAARRCISAGCVAVVEAHAKGAIARAVAAATPPGAPPLPAPISASR